MNNYYKLRIDRWISIFLSVLFAFLLATAISSCDKDIESSAPIDLSMNINCMNGAPKIEIVNNGKPMVEQTVCMIHYGDGTLDSLILQLTKGQSMVCILSNMHGSVYAEIESISLSANKEDCLAPKFQEILATFGSGLDLDSWIPTPLLEHDAMICHYTVFLENVTFDSLSTEVTPVVHGMTLKQNYYNITGDIRSESSNNLCPDFLGELVISSIMYSADAMFDNGSVNIVNSDLSVNNPEIMIDDAMDFVFNFMIDFFENNLTNEFEAVFDLILEPALSAVLVNEKSCE